MKTASITLLATAALSSAQITKNSNGTYTCALSSGIYCASASLTSNTIIRCNNHIGYASNCDTRLSSKAPEGESYSPCWQPSFLSGTAACSKNGIVYPDGNNTTPFPVPNYQVLAASVSSVATAATTTTIWPYTSASLQTQTTTSTTTNFHTSTITLNAESTPSFSNTTMPFANISANANIAAVQTTTPFLPYLPAPVIPASTIYTTELSYTYTTFCPAGATITQAGTETVVSSPTTMTLTSISQNTVTATAIVSLASPIFAFAPSASVAASKSVFWNNATQWNVTTFVAVAVGTAPLSTFPAIATSGAAVASAAYLSPVANNGSATKFQGYNDTIIPFTGAAGSIDQSALSIFGIFALTIVISFSLL